MTANRLSTIELFHSATEIVRTWPLDPADRKPAFALPTAPGRALPDGEGNIEGLDGDLWDTARQLRDGHTSVAEILAQADARANQHAVRLGAFEHRAEAEVLVRTLDNEARAGAFRGPLHGLPISVKDIIDVAGMPTRGSSVALPARMAVEDATAVARLRTAGAVLVGKVATHEFALGVTTPQAHSPWDFDRVPGGSSGGSAISLVTAMALGSLGTDTRASIRVPAALCGLVGFKPSLDLIPTDHWLTLSWSLDHFAPMARSVRDVALMMDVLTDEPGGYTRALPATLSGRRVGYVESTLAGAEPAVARRFSEALDTMERAGAVVTLLAQPTAEDFALANAAGMIVSRSEAAQFHRESGTNLESCIPEVRDQLRQAMELSAMDYIRALRLRGQLRERLATAFSAIDVLAMPTSKVVAPLRSEAGDYLLVLSENCIPWSLVNFPAISVHMGQAAGLPCGIQFVAGPGEDKLLLAVAYAFERVGPKPPIWSSG